MKWCSIDISKWDKDVECREKYDNWQLYDFEWQNRVWVQKK